MKTLVHAKTSTLGTVQGWRRFVPILAVFLVLAGVGGCASSSDNLQMDPPPASGEELTSGQKVLNVLTFPFRMIGYGLYYPLKFLFYDIWVALFGWVFGGPDEEEDVSTSIGRLADPDPNVRMKAALVLGFAGNGNAEEAALALLPLLEDLDEKVRASAVRSLGRIGKGFVEVPLAGMVSNHAREEVRAASARILGLLKAEEALWALLRGFRHPSWMVRTECALALGRIGSWTAGPKLADGLQDRDPRVRGASALALGTLGDERAIPYLRAIFKRLVEEGTFVRAAVITALAELGAKGLEEPLVAIAEGKGPVSDAYSRAATLWAIGHLKIQKGFPVLEKILLSGQESLKVMEGASVGLGLGGARAALQAAARSEDVRVRVAAIPGLVELGGEKAIDILTGLVNDTYMDVRQRAIVALLFLGFRDAVVYVIDQLRRPDPEIRAWAYLELQRISGLDLGPEPGPWLSWWQEGKDDWELRRFYPEPEGR